jgi:hypothetical protein
MRKLVLTIILCFSVIIFSGFVETQQLSPVIERPYEQEMIYVQGHKALVLSRPEFKIATFGFIEESGDLILNIAFQNISDSPINFIPENITVVGANNNGDEISLYIYPVNEYVDKIASEATTYNYTTVFWGNSTGIIATKNYDSQKVQEQTDGLLRANTIAPQDFIAGFLPVQFYDSGFFVGRLFRKMAKKRIQYQSVKLRQ